MKKKQTIWSKIKTLLIGVFLTIGIMLIIGATRVNPPPLFPEIMMGQVDVDDEPVQLAATGGPSADNARLPSFFSIVDAEGDDNDDNDFLDFLNNNERDRDGNRAQAGSGRR